MNSVDLTNGLFHNIIIPVHCILNEFESFELSDECTFRCHLKVIEEREKDRESKKKQCKAMCTW